MSEYSFTYNKEDISYSIFEHKTSSTITFSTSNHTAMIDVLGYYY